MHIHRRYMYSITLEGIEATLQCKIKWDINCVYTAFNAKRSVYYI